MTIVFAWMLLASAPLAQFPPHIDLGELGPPQGTRILELDQLGPAAAPDLDGDGFDDFVLGAPLAHFGGTYSGSVYVLFGPLGTPYGLAPESEYPTRGLRVDGPTSSGRLGQDLASVGDVNGDGLEDLGIASIDEAWVLFGGTHLRGTTSLDLSTLDGTLGFRFATAVPGTTRHVFAPIGDVNGDGVSDLFLGLPGKDDPWTSIPLANDVRSVAAGDVDGDGDQDLLAAEGDYGTIAVLFNAGDGSFPVRTTLALPVNRELYLHDLDGDGDQDLVAEFEKFLSGGVVEGSFAVFTNPGDGAFVLREQHRIDAIGRGVELALGDLDGDGDPDLAGINFLEGTSTPTNPVTSVSTFTNDGTGHFALRHSRQFSYHSQRVALLDVDGDLDNDVLVATQRIVAPTTPRIRIHPNVGSGTFAAGVQLTVPSFSASLAAADVDGDGREDLFTERMFFPNSPAGLLAGVSISYPRTFGGRGRLADIDGSGTLDLVVGDDQDGILVNRNPGNGVFDDQRVYRFEAVEGEPVCVDLDGDGDLDVVVEERARLVLAFQRGAGAFGGSSSGAAFVLFGHAGIGSGGTLDLDALDGSDGFRIPGAESYAQLGNSASRAGDMNGDGRDDFVFSAPFTDGDRGDLFVVHGASGLGATGVLDPFALSPATGIRIHGIEPGGFCRTVLGGLDVDGDGRPDLVSGGPSMPWAGASDAGRVSVVFGSQTLAATGTFDLHDLDGRRGYAILGEGSTGLGGRVLGLGDHDGDGRDDFAVGAIGDDSGGENKGAVYVVLGARRGEDATLPLHALPGRQGVALHPELERSFVGRDLAAGDWNADGRLDLYIPSPALFPGAPSPGNVHIVSDLGRVRYRWAQLR